MITIRNAVKKFGPVTAVAGVDLDIARGECFGLLGPNGAGKTSLMRTIIAASPLDEGSIQVDGKDVARQAREIKACLGVVPQEDNLDPDLTVLENLMVYARYFDIPRAEARSRAEANLQLFELLEKRNAHTEELPAA